MGRRINKERLTRVLYFSQDYTPHDFRFVNSLAESGQDVLYARLECNGSVERRPLPAGVRMVDLTQDTPGKSRKAYEHRVVARLKELVNEFQPDVVHAGPLPGPAFLAARAGLHPLVSMSWGSDLLLETRRSLRAAWRAFIALRHSDWLVGDCLAVRDRAAQLGFPSKRTTLFPWGIDLQKFTPGDENELRVSWRWEKQFVLLSLRAWEPIYGVEDILQAFARARRFIPELRLLLLGKGSQEERIHQLLRELDLHEFVRMDGNIPNDELVRYYRACDLYVSASHSDGSSVSLMEALACGKPVVVSDIPGNREWVDGTGVGWMFRDGSETELAEKLQASVRQTERLTAMSFAARRLAEERADWSKNFPHLLIAYSSAIERAHRRKTA